MISESNADQRTSNASTQTKKTAAFLDMDVMHSIKNLSTGNNFIYEITNTFINDATNLVSEMESAIANKNFTLYMENMHALKGSAGSVGAMKLFEQCKATLLMPNREVNYISNLRKTNKLLQVTIEELNNFLSQPPAHTSERTG